MARKIQLFHKCALFALSLTVVSSLTTPSARAAVLLPDATYQVYLQDGNSAAVVHPNAPGTYAAFGLTATLVTAPAVILDVTASGGQTWATSLVSIGYYWTVTGPVFAENVPVLIDTYALLSAGVGDDHSNARADATISITSPVDEARRHLECTALAVLQTTSCSKEQSETLRIRSLVGYDSSVSLNVYAETELLGNGFAVAHGYLDPHIYIDPSFPNADQYSIQLSAGIGNALPNAPSAVPEPASFWLLGSALGGVAMWGRRKHSISAR